MSRASDTTPRHILDRFILGQLVAPFLFGIMSFTVILVAGSLLFRIADLVIQRGVSLGVVTRLFLYSLPGVVVLTIPMSCLLSALLGFSGMSSNSELVALKSAGLSFGRIIRPVVMAGLAVSIVSFAMNETLVPLTQRAAANILRYDVFKRVPPILKEHVFIKEESDGVLRRVVYIGSIKPRTGEMSDIFVQEFEKGQIVRIVTATSGQWINGVWWLLNGQVFEVASDGAVRMLFTFERQQLDLAMTPQDVGRESVEPDEMNLPELYATIKSFDKEGMETGKLWMLLNLRIAVPWASAILALVGASVGSRPQRSSSGMGLGLSVIIVFVYYVVMSFCQSLGEAGYMPAVLAAWMPNAVFLAVGLLLARRANNLG